MAPAPALDKIPIHNWELPLDCSPYSSLHPGKGQHSHFFPKKLSWSNQERTPNSPLRQRTPQLLPVLGHPGVPAARGKGRVSTDGAPKPPKSCCPIPRPGWSALGTTWAMEGVRNGMGFEFSHPNHSGSNPGVPERGTDRAALPCQLKPRIPAPALMGRIPVDFVGAGPLQQSLCANSCAFYSELGVFYQPSQTRQEWGGDVLTGRPGSRPDPTQLPPLTSRCSRRA